MKPVISLIEALNAVKNNLTSLNEQKEKLSRRIGDINGEITALQDMPLSLNDYCSFIPEYIERFGQEEYRSFKHALCNGSGSEGNAERWGNLESENGDISGLLRLVGLGGNISPADTGMAVMRKLCFFFPDVVASRLTEALEKDKSVAWGNDKLPSLAERRKTVAALVSERTGLESELAAVSEEIAGITGISGLSLTE
ncbi:hypothetical protein [Enterobacter hormaechei]|uniref:hypothetical protein n=1 Tax=Enterobacter hormaechei TaxID=158836 RepID=UPI00203E7C4E|nr:hypothetical protein [Enterobacter hormaechei]HCR2082238.1 hypothetical protein [Enterobacter hormaechei subsp. hoffmannii]MDM6736475.1 hypothetical protein [Enterobacter hormaechei]MDM6754943.1 hypothetical protein [Enterobacter hormaechei]MDM6894573.1 hypothetical protein [Enterobacter hormaechei]MDM6899136.1 hypothetical protein [Enterobacter hormaechei]